MARSLSSAAALAASVSHNIALSVNRRGYTAAAAAAAGVRRSVDQKTVARKVVDSTSTAASSSTSASSNSWVPDPVTGYYRPGNLRAQVDAAELREMSLSHKQ
ncbi:Late embryogenesis abundant protein [Musa troglodytarum]|uniref:Late embryogenesis abundant protein n=1 Tax=Musa troglodytarum TaxID=320322 RepID=A0A9E7G8U5_9LILI|nr:Late embryogenesis abundant protein [Musa troglodytarum]